MLLGFVRWATDEGIIQLQIKKTNVLGRKKGGERARGPYKDEEINKLIESTLKFKSTRLELLLILLLTIAPRASEIANIKWVDVLQEPNYIFLKRKGGKLISLPICTEIQNSFSKWFMENNEPDQSSYVFSKGKKQRPNRFDIYSDMKNLFKIAGISYRGVHLFRHNLATTFDNYNIQNSMFLKNFGWEDERQKKIYVKNKDDDILRNLQQKLIGIYRFKEEN